MIDHIMDSERVGVVALLLCAISGAVSLPPDWLVYNITTEVRSACLKLMTRKILCMTRGRANVVSEPDPSRGGGGKGLGTWGTILHSSCPQVRMLT